MNNREELEHSFLGTTWNKVKHKYYQKIKVGKTWRYFYSKEEWDAYNKSNNQISGALSILLSKPVLTFLGNVTGEIYDTFAAKHQMEEKEKKDKNLDNNKYLYKIKLSDGSCRYFYTQEEYDAYINQNKEIPEETERLIDYQKNEPSFMINVPEYDIENQDNRGLENNALEVNPNYNPDEYAYSYNCYYCTTAYELRRRGYDVEAAPSVEGKYDATLKTFNKFYKDPDIHETYTVKQALYELDHDMPDNSRGNLCVYWRGGGGHSMVWEKVNGTTYIIDTQNGSVYNSDDIEWSSDEVYYVRTDNLELKPDVLKAVKY